MDIYYISKEKKVGEKLERYFNSKHKLTTCETIPTNFKAYQTIIIVEPYQVKNQYLSIYHIWKRFLAVKSPHTKLIIAGFCDIDHPNYLQLLEVHEDFDLDSYLEMALPSTQEWETDLNPHGRDYNVLSRLKRFFKGHNYESIIDSISKVRQVLSDADLSVKGSKSANRKKEDFKKVWVNQLHKKKPYFRSFYSRWSNYKAYFECLPIIPQLKEQKVEQVVEDLHQLFDGKRELSEQELLKKEHEYRRIDPFSKIGNLTGTLRNIDKRFIDPQIIGRILLIEDDILFHQQMKESFLNFSFTGLFATKEARALDKTQEFDIILLDLELEPGRYDGIDLIAFLKDLYPQTPLSIVSTHCDREIIRETMRQGAGFFLCKSNFNIEKWTRDFYSLMDNRKFSATEVILLNETEPPNQRPTILIVEDEPDWYEQIIKLSTAYHYKQATTVTQARDTLRAERFDLIILDLFFDEEGGRNPLGLELVPELKQNYPDVPLIVSTIAKGDQEIMQELNKYDVDHILDKREYDAMTWLKTIDSFIEFKKSRDRLKTL